VAREHTFFAAPRFVGAVVFLVVAAALGFPAMVFLGAAAFFAAGAFAGAFLGAAGLDADLEGGLEF